MPAWLILGLVFLWLWSGDEKEASAASPPDNVRNPGGLSLFMGGAPDPKIWSWDPTQGKWVMTGTPGDGSSVGKIPVSPGMFVAGGTVNGGQAGQPPVNVWGTTGTDTTVGAPDGVVRY